MFDTVDANPAESSPAAVDPSSVISSLTAEQRDTWQLTGKLPDPTPPADSSPAKPAEQAASTDAKDKSAASEADAPRRKNGEDRKAELEADIQARLKRRHEIQQEIEREERRLAAMRQPDVKPAESSTAAAQTLPGKPDHTDATKYPEGQYDARFIEDLAEWKAKSLLASERAQEQARRAEAARREAEEHRTRSFHQRLDEAVKADKKFLDTIAPAVLDLRPTSALERGERPGPLNTLADEIFDSPHGPQLMRLLSESPDALSRFAAMRSPREVVREVARLERSLEAPEPKAPEPPAKTVTSAPTPPVTVGRTPTEPADEIQGAMKAGDFARYAAAANARDMARRR